MRIVEVDDLTFLGDRDYPISWFRRHLRHFRVKLALRKADRVIVPDYDVAVDLVRYYFFPKDKIEIRKKR